MIFLTGNPAKLGMHLRFIGNFVTNIPATYQQQHKHCYACYSFYYTSLAVIAMCELSSCTATNMAMAASIKRRWEAILYGASCNVSWRRDWEKNHNFQKAIEEFRYCSKRKSRGWKEWSAFLKKAFMHHPEFRKWILDRIFDQTDIPIELNSGTGWTFYEAVSSM